MKAFTVIKCPFNRILYRFGFGRSHFGAAVGSMSQFWLAYDAVAGFDGIKRATIYPPQEEKKRHSKNPKGLVPLLFCEACMGSRDSSATAKIATNGMPLVCVSWYEPVTS
jgi:hypothetical protein